MNDKGGGWLTIQAIWESKCMKHTGPDLICEACMVDEVGKWKEQKMEVGKGDVSALHHWDRPM